MKSKKTIPSKKAPVVLKDLKTKKSPKGGGTTITISGTALSNNLTLTGSNFKGPTH
jgi:hypothetical protein